MKIILSIVPADKVMGIYNVGTCRNGDVLDEAKRARRLGDYAAEKKLLFELKPGGLPDKLRMMHPAAAAAMIRWWDTEPEEHRPIISDMYRSGASSLVASQNPDKKALPPGYSGHGFGESIDTHHTAMRRRAGFKTKKELDALLAKYEFFNFWVDGIEEHEHEDWHNNHMPAVYRDKDGGFSSSTTRGYLEAMTVKRYGAEMKLTVAEAQTALNKLDFHVGDADGVMGKLTAKGLREFQHMWMPKHQTGELDAQTMRTLAFTTAEIVIVPPGAWTAIP